LATFLIGRKTDVPVFIGFGRLGNDFNGAEEVITVPERLWRFYRGFGVFVEPSEIL
jgi:hypothetical protein